MISLKFLSRRICTLRLLRFSLLLFVVSLILGCKSSNESSQRNTGALEKPYNPQMQQLEFRAAYKGILVNARAEVYLANGEQVDWSRIIGFGTSDVDGWFSIALDERLEGSSIVLKVVAAEGESISICSVVVGGCDGAAFGETFVVQEDFTLYLGIPNLNFDNLYSISALSDIAFSLADRKRLEPNFNERLLNANAELTNLFGISAPLETLPIINISDEAELAGSSVAAIRASLLNSSIISASTAEYSIKSDTGLPFFKDQLLALGIPGNSNLDVIVSKLDIYDQMSELLTVTGLDRDNPLLAGQIKASEYLAFVERSNRFEMGSTDIKLVPPLPEQAKRFVETLRQIAASIDFSQLSSITNFDTFLGGGTDGVFEGLGVSFSELDVLGSDESKAIFSSLSRVFIAVLKAQIVDLSSSEIPQVVDSIPLNPRKENGEYLFQINSFVDGCLGQETCNTRVDLEISSDFDVPDGDEDGLGLTILGVTYSISGTLAFGSTQFELNTRNQVFDLTTLDIKLPQGRQFTDDLDSLSVSVETAVLRLPFVETMSDDNKIVRLNGVVDVSLENLSLDYATEESSAGLDAGLLNKLTKVGYRVKHLDYLNFNIASAASSNVEDTFLGALNVSTTKPINSDSIEFVQKVTETCEVSAPSTCTDRQSSIGLEGETEDHFAELNASVLFKANLAGVVDPLLMQISGYRTSPSSSEIDQMRLAQPDQSIVLSGEFTNTGVNRLDAVNQDGLTMKIDMPEGGGERFGGIWSANGEQLATMKDFRTWLKITFRDGYFVSM